MTAPRGERTRPEPRSNAGSYWKKSMRFAAAARTNAADGNWDPAVANAINAVINSVDALCVHYQGVRSASGSHQEALQLLDACQELAPSVREGLRRHLVALLSQKTFAQYDSRLMEEGDAEAALRHMDRALSMVTGTAERSRWGA